MTMRHARAAIRSDCVTTLPLVGLTADGGTRVPHEVTVERALVSCSRKVDATIGEDRQSVVLRPRFRAPIRFGILRCWLSNGEVQVWRFEVVA